MLTFLPWVSHQQHRFQLLQLVESAAELDTAEYNQVFESELERLRQSVSDAEVKAKLENLKGLDWSGYIAKQLRLSGFRGHELDEFIHEIVVKLLVAPGKLFHGWNPRHHGPLDRRFGASVRNQIANIISKRANRRKYLPAVSINNDFQGHGVGEKYLPASRTSNDPLIADFREFLHHRLGPLAVALFDTRLNGDDAGELVGDRLLGSPTRYKLRTTLQSIKRAALEFADGALRDRVFELIGKDREGARRMRDAGVKSET